MNQNHKRRITVYKENKQLHRLCTIVAGVAVGELLALVILLIVQ